MASQSLRLQLQTELDNKLAIAQIKALGQQNTVIISLKFNEADNSKLMTKIEQIRQMASQMGSIKIFGDQAGNVNKAIITYTDMLGKARQETLLINKDVEKTVISTQNLAKEEREIISLQTKQDLNEKKILETMNRQVQKAKEFLEWSKTRNQSAPNVAQGISVANQIIGEKDPAKVQQLTNKLAVLKQGMLGTSSANISFTEGMRRSITTVAEYALSTGILYAALNQLKQGIQYIIDLNKVMVDTQLVTGGTAEQMKSLAMDYNNLAREMGSTTKEIAKGSLEFVRQGKSAEDTAILIRSSTMLSKLGNMEAADATEKLTSIMNGFRIEAEETTDVVDKLVGLDNAYATSVDKISTSMKYSSNVAQQVGVDFDHLAA